MLIAGVGQHDVDEDAQAMRMDGGDERIGVLVGADIGSTAVWSTTS